MVPLGLLKRSAAMVSRLAGFQAFASHCSNMEVKAITEARFEGGELPRQLVSARGSSEKERVLSAEKECDRWRRRDSLAFCPEEMAKLELCSWNVHRPDFFKNGIPPPTNFCVSLAGGR